MSHHPLPTFQYPHDYPRDCYHQRGFDRKQEPHVLLHLRELRDQIEAMTDDERAVNLLNQWLPTVDDLDYLLSPALRQRDRVEAIIIMHKRDVGGDSPSFTFIGSVLGISKTSVLRLAGELIDQRRAHYECKRFVLIEGQYTHPLLRRRIPPNVLIGTVPKGTLAC
jgi:hypothetical protein